MTTPDNPAVTARMWDSLAFTEEEDARIDAYTLEIAEKDPKDRTEAESLLLRAYSHITVMRGRNLNLRKAYDKVDKAYGVLSEEKKVLQAAGEQQAEIIGRVHDFCDSLARSVEYVSAKPEERLIGELHAMSCILADARRAAGLDTDNEDDNV